MFHHRNLFSSLRGRLLFLVCLVTFPVFIFAFYLADKERISVLSRIKRDALHIAKLASREHAHQIRGAQNLLLWLGNKLSIEGKNSLIMKDPTFLSTILAGHPQLSNIGILSTDGNVIASAYPLKHQISWKNNPAFQMALKNIDITAGNYAISPIFERPTLNHFYSIKNKNKQVWGVLFNGLNLEWLSQLALQAKLPKGFSLLITDKKGKILAHDQGNSTVDLILSDSHSKIIDNSDTLAGTQGKIINVDGTVFKRYFLSFPLEESTNLYVVVGLDYEKIFAEAAHTFYRTLGWISVLIIFTIIIVLLVAEISILRVLRTLALSVQKFGSGDLAIRVKPISGSDEFSLLANSFNTMADTLALKYNELLDAKSQLRALAAKIQTLREEEAKRISRELHDEIGQMLTSLKIDLAQLKIICISDNTQTNYCSHILNQKIEQLVGNISTSIDLVRKIAAELRPTVLDKLGFFAAVQWQAHEIESKTNLVIQVDLEGNELLINEKISIVLFRIIQEALTNIVRHANAKVAEIKISMDQQEINLNIEDDGIGFPIQKAELPTSLGIIGMKERISEVNGKIIIANHPKNGTIIHVIIPLIPNKEVK